MDMTAADLLKRAVAYKPQQRLNTAQPIRSDTHPSLLNKSHTGRHTAKQGANLTVHIDLSYPQL